MHLTDLRWVVGREEAKQQQQHHAGERRQPLRVDADVRDDEDDEADNNAEVNRPTQENLQCEAQQAYPPRNWNIVVCT